MMGALLRNSFTIYLKGLEMSHKHQRISAKTRKKCYVHCQSGSNVTKSDKFTPILSERSTSKNTGHGAAIMDPSSSLVLNPNGKNSADLVAKDLAPYNGASSTLAQVQEGIGIVKFLRGKTFFVTGATGFLAKVLIEKILRTVPDVGKIYVLIKAKNKEVASKRLKNEIMNTEIFKCLQQIHGKSYETFMLSKLVPVVGNICESNLGLDEASTSMIAEDVDVIVNSAANTNFHERYDVAVDINTRGPGRVMAFAKKCRKLKLFLQVSTAYVNGQRQGRIMERPFRKGESITEENIVNGSLPCPMPLLDVEGELNLAFTSAEGFEENKVSQKMKELGLERARKYGWQDTYVFTKAMGEMLLGSTRGDVPVVILRPSVIESTYQDPFPGWIEGNRMMDPVVTYYGKGLLSGFPVDPFGVIDVVPADMVVNATLAAIAKHGTAGKPEISVYQVASSVENPLVYGDLGDLLHQYFTRWPCLDTQGRPIQVEPFKFYGSMDDFSSHIWRETVRYISSSMMPSPNGKQSKKIENLCRKAVEQAKHLASVYEPYSFYGGRFDNSSTSSLMESMSDEESRTFYFDVGSINWTDYICSIHIPGLRKHVMKGRGQSS
ncbi:fatty acyl-CoA reductase 2-like [Chenopodium quinoa]|uniref:Fatty acyl-CoA reductase n=1 Tax=Chenopodium quinoa TaxID=63459 RepID=A0A803LTB0_CHEQI|nr:fatty acyl-CoA reductase 2-like [Chenopodium quinoa]